MLSIFLFATFGFISGSFPTAVVYCRFAHKVDIRTLGSGNPGATNVFRNFGKRDGWFVLITDALKGFLPVFFQILYTRSLSWPPREPMPWIYLTVICCVAGHIFSPFLKFKGGKGVATGAGAMLAALPMCFLPSLIVWIVVLRGSKFMSLASLSAAYTFLILTLYQYGWSPTSYVSLFLAILLTYTHRANLIRLSKGNEPKFSFTKQN